ncbi:hypothetical protein CC80DRAFT_508022 [Byssothecium circinans]|uniref:Uncharacterized protein n=1 Tax=Byssothecium circinans TaxID=147558 RepID=A0A6A5TK58_9PLEO|nr:hypothetical protein CC80DRAFT_508022 [Byssothecium circinans]
MATGALFCDNVGKATDKVPLNCCYANNQTSPTCKRIFNPYSNTFKNGGCPNGNCLAECSNITMLYESLSQDDYLEGDGRGPIIRYRTCINVPTMAGYLRQSGLSPTITDVIANNISSEATDAQLKNVTAAVTDCLASTCRNARKNDVCKNVCSPVSMLTNSTAPNVDGVNRCLHLLCRGGYNTVPFADADVVGIGVFSSYIMQCALVVILWFGLSLYQIRRHGKTKHRRSTPPPERMTDKSKTEKSVTTVGNQEGSHQERWENLIVDFHKTQCYFSATIQIASLSYGIFETNMLITFMLTPIATNGVLPVVFAYYLLIRCGKAKANITLLTVGCWLLSSIVYWILYRQMIPLNIPTTPEVQKFRAYQQFIYKLSALDACGGYSALAVCPFNFALGTLEISTASHKLRVFTPIIWTFSTAALIVALAVKFTEWNRRRLDRRHHGGYESTRQSEADTNIIEPATSPSSHNPHVSLLRSRRGAWILYWFASACFLAGIGMQLSLLTIGTSLNMMDASNWTFGQVVAVTIWVPSLLAWAYEEVDATGKGKILKCFGRRQRLSSFHVPSTALSNNTTIDTPPLTPTLNPRLTTPRLTALPLTPHAKLTLMRNPPTLLQIPRRARTTRGEDYAKLDLLGAAEEHAADHSEGDGDD